jgi:maltose alpha-D-glucosyltransferase/alpha-amylase
MLRSFDYARQSALDRVAKTAPELERLAPVAQAWGQQVRAAFLDAYREVALAGGLYADETAYAAAQEALALFEIEKALYELRYELDNRPDWVGVPLAGLAALAGLTTRIGLGA